MVRNRAQGSVHGWVKVLVVVECANGGLWWATSAPPRVTHRPGGSAEYTPHCIVSGCFALTNGVRVRSRVLCSCSFSNVRALSQRPHSRCMAQSPAGSHVHRTRAPIAPGRSGLRVGNIVRRTGCTARGRSSLYGRLLGGFHGVPHRSGDALELGNAHARLGQPAEALEAALVQLEITARQRGR